MRLRAAVVLAAMLSAGAAAEAGMFGHSDNLPKPIDDVTNFPKLPPFDHKQGRYTLHHGPAKYYTPTWGAEWKTIFREHEIRINHSLR